MTSHRRQTAEVDVMDQPAQISPKTFQKFRDLVYERSGISLGPGKESLVAARVGKRMRALGLTVYEDYLAHVQRDQTGEEIVLLLDAISTNVTSFYREGAHFEMLSGLMEKWIGQGQRRFRFWSAACSTGEEPYTMAITLREALGGRPADVRILATDISTRALGRAIEGVYEAEKVAPIPLQVRNRYFDMVREGADKRYAARAELKEMVAFRRLNLSSPPFPMQGPMDAVFCRNVMIYFDATVRRNLLAEIHRLLKPGGYLMVGHAESLTGVANGFRTVKPSVYVKE